MILLPTLPVETFIVCIFFTYLFSPSRSRKCLLARAPVIGLKKKTVIVQSILGLCHGGWEYGGGSESQV